MNESTKCSQCGGELPAHFPPGVCPACLLKQGMSPSTVRSAEGSPDQSGRSGPRRHWLAQTPAELAPRFPQLEIVELLGQGGMGAVYKVRQRDLDRWAALKILPDDVAADPNFAERFQREARALALLGHQHIVTVYEFGQRDGVYYLLMEYVDGVTLRQASRAGQVSAADALSIVMQICDALQFAHEEGVVHRDIKPENILIDKRGRVKIADFGLAKLLGKTADTPTLTGTRQVMGTPIYMAPEQMEGTKGVDHRADIFSLGVVFYELLTGELPLGRFAPPSQKYSLDVRLDEVVLRTLEKEPDRRYQQASQVRCDVESIRNKPATKARTTARMRWPWPLAKTVAAALIVVVGTVAGLVGCTIVGAWINGDFQPTPPSFVKADERPWSVSQSGVAEARYLERIERERVELQRQSQQEAEARDPNELNAIVQFSSDLVKLHPHAFGAAELTPEQRVTLEKIMTDIHRKFLVVEARHSARETYGTAQIVNFDNTDEEFYRLENEFWIAVDTQFPLAVQKLLRQRLPLHTDPAKPLPLVGSTEQIISPSASSAGPPGVGGGMSPFGAPQTQYINLRYQQVLGWKNVGSGIRIAIWRKGKWYSWTIHQGRELIQLDDGEASELPSGLRRFWREPGPDSPALSGSSANSQPIVNDSPEAAFERINAAYIAQDWPTFARGHTREARDEFSALLLLSVMINTGHSKTQISESLHREFPNIDLSSAESQGAIQAALQTIRGSTITRSGMRTMAGLLIEQLFEDMGTNLFAVAAELNYLDLGGSTLFGTLKLQSVEGDKAFGRCFAEDAKMGSDGLPIWFKLQNGEWKVDGYLDIVEINLILAGNDAGSPARKAVAPPTTATKPEADLAELLSDLDHLRAGDRTPWDVVETRTNELLATYPAPGDKGRIHWQAAHVYGQSDIRGHAADVMRHAKEALKYERDPGQRGWLFMSLGNAAEVVDADPKTFVERRTAATRWYLKGYLELLPFNLPNQAPELPPVAKLRSELVGETVAEIDHDRIAAEVRFAAQLKVRKEAELTRELFHRREVYLTRLQDLYGRMHELYDKDTDAKLKLKEVVVEVLRDEQLTDELLRFVWPPQFKLPATS